MHELRRKSKGDLLNQLKELKTELAALRVAKVTGGAPNKLSKIKVVRLSIAQVLTVIRQNQLTNLREAYGGKMSSGWKCSQGKAITIAVSVAAMVVLAISNFSTPNTALYLGQANVARHTMASMIPVEAQRLMYGIARPATADAAVVEVAEDAEDANVADAVVPPPQVDKLRNMRDHERFVNDYVGKSDRTKVKKELEEGTSGKDRIRMKLKSFYTPQLEDAARQILDVCQANEMETSGIVRLPTKRKIFCVLRSPHVDKDSREHFEVRSHSRVIDVRNPTPQIIDSLMGLSLPPGVFVEVKLA